MGLSPPGRGEAEPLLKEVGEGQASSLYQVIYNHWFVEMPKRLVRWPRPAPIQIGAGVHRQNANLFPKILRQLGQPA